MVPYLQPLRKNTKCYNWLFLKANSGTKGNGNKSKRCALCITLWSWQNIPILGNIIF